MNERTCTLEDLLKYSDVRYEFAVFRGDGTRCGEHDFWSLEVSESDARDRVAHETDSYEGPEWKFFYLPIKRETVMMNVGNGLQRPVKRAAVVWPG